jgi:hypothetical protein
LHGEDDCCDVDRLRRCLGGIDLGTLALVCAFDINQYLLQTYNVHRDKFC